MTQQSAEPMLTGVRNFRDVGGLPTTDGRRVLMGRLFRSGHLAHATPEDASFLSGLGLHTVFDFRNSADQALEGPDIDLPGVRNVNIPLTDPAHGAEFWDIVRNGDVPRLRTALADGLGEAQMIGAYRSIILDRTAEHSRVLHALAADSLPALMHCAAGKDRAGLTIAVTLLALGVEKDAIEADYLESNAPHHRYNVQRNDSAEQTIAPQVMTLLAPLFDARIAYLAAAFEAIEQTWGGVEEYFTKGLSLSPAARERLRDRLLTSS